MRDAAAAGYVRHVKNYTREVPRIGENQIFQKVEQISNQLPLLLRWVSYSTQRQSRAVTLTDIASQGQIGRTSSCCTRQRSVILTDVKSDCVVGTTPRFGGNWIGSSRTAAAAAATGVDGLGGLLKAMVYRIVESDALCRSRGRRCVRHVVGDSSSGATENSPLRERSW